MSCDTFPDCPAGEAAKDQFKQHSEVTKKLEELGQDQKQLITGFNKIEVLLSELNHITADFRDFREQTRKAFDNLFKRMTDVEQGKAELTELREMQKTGTGWLYDIAKVAIIGIVAFIAAKISIVTTMAQVSGK